MSSSFRKQFMRGSQPEPDPAKNPTPAEIRTILDRVHQQSLAEMETFSVDQLAEPVSTRSFNQPAMAGWSSGPIATQAPMPASPEVSSGRKTLSVFHCPEAFEA